MKLTQELKDQISAMSYTEMLSLWRFASIGEGESGEYFGKRLFSARDADPNAAVAASKYIGWEK